MEYCPNCVTNLKKVKLKGVIYTAKKLKCPECGFETSDRWEEIEEQLRIDNLRRNEYDKQIFK